MNTEFPELNTHSIFPIKLDEGYLVYAPLSDGCMKCDPGEAEAMERAVASGQLCDSPYQEVLTPLIDDAASFIFPEVSHKGLTNMSIFPTWSCNFNCTYCYASNHHVKGDMTPEIAFRALDYFFSLNRDPVYLQLLGGGEPFTKWNIVRYIAAYARQLEKKSGRPLTISVATNGSIFNDEIVRDILDLDIRISFSFDILEDIQNRQRGMFAIVRNTLKRMLDAGLGDRIFLRTVVTPYSVNALGRMVKEVMDEYRGICGVIAEPVMGQENFRSADDYGEFCRTFYKEFSVARATAIESGLEFTTMILRNMDFSIDRSCEGDFCVTPEGRIFVCHRLALPSESVRETDTCAFGRIESGMVYIDEDRYLSLTNHSVSERDECRYCFAKFNCGGGCIARNLSESEESKRHFCLLTRSLLLDELIRRFNDNEQSIQNSGRRFGEGA